jgi:hypothetical protein
MVLRPKPRPPDPVARAIDRLADYLVRHLGTPLVLEADPVGGLLHPAALDGLAELEAIERATSSSAVREEVAALALLLQQFGPQLRRPHCDTLKGSKHPNMKELRFTLPDGEWRVAFAFDPRRLAILLVAGNKSGTNERRFYRQLIRTADARFDAHLQGL